MSKPRRLATLALVAGTLAVATGVALPGVGPATQASRPGAATDPSPFVRVQAAPPGRASAVPPVSVPNFTTLVERVGPAVVNITTTRKGARSGSPDFGISPDDPMFEFFRRFLPQPPGGGEEGRGPREFRSQGLGSGFIVSADGFILTNAHVVAEATEVTVRLADAKREFKARVIGLDARTDVALLKVDASDLPAAKLATSERVRPGEWVAAIGSPFGFDNTITAGIVSATERALPSESLVPFIQTDVAVNPGNSGGPLINLQGEVVGINSQIYSRTGGYMGVSFAIPIEVAMDVAEQLRTTGKVTRGRLGVSIQPVTQELARSFGLEQASGVLVAGVEPNSPASRAGLASGDIILSFNGKPVRSANELPRNVAGTKPGTEVSLEVWRKGRRQTLAATVGEFAAEQQPVAQAPRDSSRAANRLGLVVSELPAERRRALGIDHGLVVDEVQGPASETQIRRGDVIVALNGSPLESVKSLEEALAAQQSGSSVALLVRRGDASLYVPVPVG